MIQPPQNIWQKLEQTHPEGENLVARLVLPEVTDRIIFALDVDNLRHILIRLDKSDDDLIDIDSRGINVVTRELVITGQQFSRYIDIACRDVSGNNIFDLIGTEILNEIIKSIKQPAEIAKHILNKWRRFWGQPPRQILTREEQIGLFAELWFLSNWVLHRLGNEAINSWRGPMGGRHDFEWSGYSVEVKATTSTRGRIHKIHGLSQLEPPENGILELFSLQLREEAGAENNLPSLIKVCQNQLEKNNDALSYFETAIYQSGYISLYDEDYSNLKFRVISEALFSVRADFPRIISSSFVNGLSHGVELVDYDINLNTFNHLLSASTVHEWNIK